MWNFLGWDNATTYAGEVQRPVRSYVLSIGIAFLLILGIYFLTALSVHWSGIDPATLDSEDHGFPVLGNLVGGRWLGILVAVGGMASQLGLYSAVLLSVSRVPQVMADDQLLPGWFCAFTPVSGHPTSPYSCLLSIVSILVLFTFSDLVVMDIILYGAGLFLEFIALLILRVREPQPAAAVQDTPNIAGLIVMILLPTAIYLIALTGVLYSSEKMWGPVAARVGYASFRRPGLAGRPLAQPQSHPLTPNRSTPFPENKPTFHQAEGIPFVFEQFTVLGNYIDLEKFGKEPWTKITEMGSSSVTAECPAPKSVIRV